MEINSKSSKKLIQNPSKTVKHFQCAALYLGGTDMIHCISESVR